MKLTDVWVSLLRDVLKRGEVVSDETGDYMELPMMSVWITDFDRDSSIIVDNVPQKNIEDMKKVFVGGGKNQYGHDYWTPIKESGQLALAVEQLRRKPSSRKAIIVLGQIEGVAWVPCINAFHLWLRDDHLNLHYFSRGQDLWEKFVPDILALRDLQVLFADELGPNVQAGHIAGTISSGHIYKRNVLASEAVLSK